MHRVTILLVLILFSSIAFATGQTDEITINLFGAFSVGTYKECECTSKVSGTTIYGNLTAFNSAIALRETKNSGIITKGTPYANVVEIRVEWHKSTIQGRQLVVYGKTTAYSDTKDLANNAKKGSLIQTVMYDGIENEVDVITVNGAYKYFGFLAKGGTSYINKITIKYIKSNVEAPTFDVAGGCYDCPQRLVINSEKGTVIKYKTKGAEKNEVTDWIEYTAPLYITDYTEITAQAYKEGESSEETTSTYIIGKRVAWIEKASNKYYALTNDGNFYAQQIQSNDDGTFVSASPEAVSWILYRQPSYDASYPHCASLRSMTTNQYLALDTKNNATMADTETPWYWSANHALYNAGTSNQYTLCLKGSKFNATTLPSNYDDRIFYKRINDYGRAVNTDEWGTLCLSAAVNAHDFVGGNVYEILCKTMDGDKVKNIVLKEVVGNLEAGMPYIFHANENATTIAAYYHDTTTTTAYSKNGLHGTLKDIDSFEEYDPANLFVLNDNAIKPVESGNSLTANQAYIIMDEVPNRDSASINAEGLLHCVIFGMDGNVVYTDITEPKSLAKDGNIYSLNGIKLKHPRRGTNIINGKKVAVTRHNAAL